MNDWEARITTFLCNWCSYVVSTVSKVGDASRQRHTVGLVLAAFRHGADGVWVSG